MAVDNVVERFSDVITTDNAVFNSLVDVPQTGWEHCLVERSSHIHRLEVPQHRAQLIGGHLRQLVQGELSTWIFPSHKSAMC